MAAPSGSDLTAFLSAMGVTTSLTVADLVSAATEEFYRRTGRRKLEADANPASLRIKVPRHAGERIILDLPIDFYTVTDLKEGYSSTSAGTSLTLHEDYTTLPENNDVTNRPIEAIVFESWPAEDIYITGRQGYAATFPADAARAILSLAASEVIDQQAGASGNVTERKLGDRTIKYGSGEESTSAKLRRTFDDCVARYRKNPWGVR